MEQQVWAEVVTIGSELVLGQLVDTNAAFIAGSLAEIGVGLAYHTTVGDDEARMAEALNRALDRCQIVITTGGLGPTEDDLTRQVAADIMGWDLVLREDLLEFIETLFRRSGYTMAPNNRRQAYIPAGATAIHNPRGTAPAFCCERGDRTLICLPGVPWETEPLMGEAVLPFLEQKYNLTGQVLINRVLKVCGVGESNIDSQIKEVIRSSKNPVIGLQASPGEIKVRLTARADSRDEAESILDQGEARIREKIGDLIFGYGEDTLPGVTAGLIEEQGLSLAVAETLTMGRLASDLGGRLSPGRLRGGLILSGSVPAEKLAARVLDQFEADLALAVSALPGEEGRQDVEIAVLDRRGNRAGRTISMGGPPRLLLARSTTMGLATLWNFLKGQGAGPAAE